MFSKDKEATVRKGRSSPPTIISPDVRVDGNITSNGEIQIDGIVEGDIKGVKLSIGHTGSVNGAISAETTLVRGRVSGSTALSTKNSAPVERPNPSSWRSPSAILSARISRRPSEIACRPCAR